MKTPRLCLLLVALSGLSGCDTSSPCFVSEISQQPQPAMILVNEPTRVLLPPSLPIACEGPRATPDTLTVEVYDPSNQPVEHLATLNSLATIEFTPKTPGRHHLFVAFDPVGGIQQVDLYAARDRSTEASIHSLPQNCTSLERTTRGAWVCDSNFIRNGVVEQRFDNSRVLVAGDVVWQVGPSLVQRYVDTGTALTLTGSTPHLLGSPEFLLGTGTELVVLYSDTLQRLTFDGAVVASVGVTSWSPPPASISSPGPRGLLLRAGDRLALVTRVSADSSGNTIHQVCTYRLDAGRFMRTTDACQMHTITLVGFESNAVWVGDPLFFSSTEFTGLRYLEWTGSALVEQASLPLGVNGLRLSVKPFSIRSSVVPTVLSINSSINTRARTTVPVYSAERRSILFEYLGSELTEPSTSSSLAWEPNGASSGGAGAGLRIRARPSSP